MSEAERIAKEAIMSVADWSNEPWGKQGEQARAVVKALEDAGFFWIKEHEVV